MAYNKGNRRKNKATPLQNPASNRVSSRIQLYRIEKRKNKTNSTNSKTYKNLRIKLSGY